MAIPRLNKLAKWTGSQDELSELISSLVETSGFAGGRKISKRTIIYYRSKGLISKANGKIYGFKHILQCLFAIKLSFEGWKIKQMAEIIPLLHKSKIQSYLDQTVTFEGLLKIIKQESEQDTILPESVDSKMQKQQTRDSIPLPQYAVHLLAQGIIDQYQSIQSGQIADGSNMPKLLRHALGTLGKLKVLEGKVDDCASIHDVLVRSMHTLNDSEWDVDAFKEDSFPYGHITLIDPDHRCPSLECIELAQTKDDSDLREKFSFERLKGLCDAFGGRRHEAYTKTREFIIRHPLLSSQELLKFIRENNLPTLSEFLQSDCYSKLEEHHLINGHLYCCKECGAILKQVQKDIGRCPTRQCSLYQIDEALIEFQDFSNTKMVLRPHLQMYWFGPGLDEVAVYDACLANGINADLYPNSDECDVAIDGIDVGIDIKSYSSPNFLGDSLTKSIAGLKEYERKIIAINDNCLNSIRQPDYIKTLQSSYKGKEQLEFMSVSNLLEWINDNDN